jgi:hypothetical protein
MISLHADLLAVLNAVQIESNSSYRILKAKHEIVEDGSQPSLVDGRPVRLVEALAGDLYAKLYCRPTTVDSLIAIDETARRDHVNALAAANCGRGTWEAGWTVRELDTDGRLAVAKGAVTFWARPEGVRFARGQVPTGGHCRVWVPKEMRCFVPGFYMAHGDGDPEINGETAVEERMFRFYWHLTAPAAGPFIAAISSALNASRIAFQAKVLSDPAMYVRADAGVLYLRLSPDLHIGRLLSEIHSAVASGLRPSVPLFSSRIADGLGYAEDPAGSSSFGQHRCRLVAESLWDSYLQGEVGHDDRARRLASAFLTRGLDPLRPHREPGLPHELSFNFPTDRAAIEVTRPAGGRTISTAVLSTADHINTSIFECARRIGDTLCRMAYWDRDGRCCNWIGRSVTEESDGPGWPITPTASALGPDLYAGSAGIALYLAQLFAKTRDVDHRRTAVGAIARSIRQLDRLPKSERDSPLSLFSGDLGIAYAARRVATLTGERGLTDLAENIFERVVAAISQSHGLDVLTGNAGAIPVLLGLGRDTGRERFDDLAVLLGAELCEAAVREGNTCRWEPDRATRPAVATTPLSGLSHGAAGIGLAFFELHAATGRRDFLEMARGAFAFEDSLFDPEQGNWLDVRVSIRPNHFACTWCHGAPGIALTRLRAAALDSDFAEDYLKKARIALATTLDAIEINLASRMSDTCLCHGLAGLGEIALIASQRLENPALRDSAINVARAMIDRHGSSGEWPSGAPSRGPNPSLMVGLAGIGYWLLRLHDPEGVPSVLLHDP